jgi:hypothetical protein
MVGEAVWNQLRLIIAHDPQVALQRRKRVASPFTLFSLDRYTIYVVYLRKGRHAGFKMGQLFGGQISGQSGAGA